MKLVDMNIVDFLNEVDSSSPAPGGGSVSALASSLGASLGRMVGHLTIGKKKYQELDECTRDNFKDNFFRLDSINKRLIELVDKDTENFNLVMAAFKLPKTTPEEIAHREHEIEKATILATDTPLKIAELSLEILELLNIFVEHGNKNAITDVGVAALLARAGGKGGIYNVKINLPGIKDPLLVKEIKNQCEHILTKIEKTSADLEKKVESYLEG